MKNILLVLIALMVLPYRVVSQSDTIRWSGDTVTIDSDYYLPDTTLLIIDPGVTVCFTGWYKIYGSGRIEATGTETDSIKFTVKDTTGYANEYQTKGGWHGIRLTDRAGNDTTHFKYCIFEYGKAYDTAFLSFDRAGGAFYSANYNNIVFENCTFRKNFAKLRGAAIHVYNSTGLLNVLNCNFFHNVTRHDEGGAGVFSEQTNTIIKNNLFYRDEAWYCDTSYIIDDTTHDTLAIVLGFAGDGAAVTVITYPHNDYLAIVADNRIYNCKSHAGVIYSSSKHFKLINNLVVNCEGYAFWDGYGWYSEAQIVNNTFVNNDAIREPEGGVWSISHSDNYVIRNNIIYGNMCGLGPFQISPHLPAEYNCIQDGYPGEGNTSSEPRFANPTPGAGLDYDGMSADWTLLDNSPCVNSGTPDTAGLGLPPVDLNGNPRVYGNRVDMGAYENQSVWVKVNNAPLAETIKVYPNPGKEKIKVSLPPQTSDALFDLINSEGKVLFHSALHYDYSEIYPLGLPPGIYFYRIYTPGKLLKQGKWIKR